jgi:hypothetical protein
MKKIFVVMGLLLTVTMLFVGCGKTDNSSLTQAQPLSQNNERTGTLQGKIMDATTGAAIGNDDNSELKVWLIQGTDNRSTSKLITDHNDPLCGEYAFDNIPIDLYYGNTTFKVVVVKPGYQRFEADVELNDNVYDLGAINNTFDKVINMIGNIYLFKEGYRAGDLNVMVYDAGGTPIPNATVGLYLNVENNYPPAVLGTSINNTSYENIDGLNPYYDVLFPTGGLYSDMSTTTDATGMATFSGANLVLGGNYKVMVAPMNFNGQILGFDVTTIWELTVNTPVIMTLYPQTPNALFATSASNQVPGTITADGTLTVTFNQPVILSTTTIGAVMTNSTATFNTPNATGALSADGMTLTITPNFFALPAATDAGATVHYTVPQMYLKNTQTNAPAFTSIMNIYTGNNLSNAVQMISH